MVNKKRTAKVCKENHSEKIRSLYPNGVEYGTAVLVAPPTIEELGDILEEIETKSAEPTTKARTFKQAAGQPPI